MGSPSPPDNPPWDNPTTQELSPSPEGQSSSGCSPPPHWDSPAPSWWARRGAGHGDVPSRGGGEAALLPIACAQVQARREAEPGCEPGLCLLASPSSLAGLG